MGVITCTRTILSREGHIYDIEVERVWVCVGGSVGYVKIETRAKLTTSKLVRCRQTREQAHPTSKLVTSKASMESKVLH